MIKTSNGNWTLSYEEFVESFKNLGVDTSLSNTESWQGTYTYMLERGTIYKIEGMNYTYEYAQDLLARVRLEYGAGSRLFYVSMGHDCPPDGWCTQDVVSDYVIVLPNNEIRSYTYEGYKKYQKMRESK